jgi:uncharacterized repeat protein (TIGR03803 family)
VSFRREARLSLAPSCGLRTAIWRYHEIRRPRLNEEILVMHFDPWLRSLRCISLSSAGRRQRLLRRGWSRRRPAKLHLEQLETRVTPSYSLSTLASFVFPDGAHPDAGLIMDSSGNLYGTTQSQGAYGDGTVFEVAHGSSTITLLAAFNGNNGSAPYASLIMDSSGNLYGTTSGGGAFSDGTVFELAQGSSTITSLAAFNGTNGSSPYASLISDSSGNLYGTTYSRGALGYGTVFKLAQGSRTITTLASFNGTNGANPYASLIIDGSGNLYGTTYNGGTFNEGTVFELARGSGTITALASFNSNNLTAGGNPYAGLIMDSSGNLYGTTSGGGPVNATGTIFELAHGSATITVLAAFFDGANPWDGLIMDSSGNLYGTTRLGGDFNYGTVFEVAQGSGTITKLASFNGTNGAYPDARPIKDSSGNLYGITGEGGASGVGTVFELAHGSATITALASFNGIHPAAYFGSLIMDSGGNLYGITGSGNAPNYGTVFEVVPGSGTHTTLASGAGSLGGVIMDGSGNLYGEAGGGTFGDGTVFELVRGSGTFTTLASFNGSDGANPWDGLIMDSSGNLYGTSELGGGSGDGAVFELQKVSGFGITGFPSPTTAGQVGSFTVTVRDGNGNTATGYTGTVHFTSSDPQAVLPADYTFTAADQGVHTFSATLVTAGTQTLTVTDTADSTIVGTQTGIVVNPAAVSQFTVDLFPGPEQAGLTAPFRVTARDAYQNVVPSYTGTVHFTSSEPANGVRLPPDYTFVPGDHGSRSLFHATFFHAGTQSITVTDTSNSAIIGSQTGIVISTAPVTHFRVYAFPNPTIAGVGHTITVAAKDSFGNTVTGYTGTVVFSSTDPLAVLPGQYSFTAADAGVHTFGVVLKTVGTQSITVTDMMTSTITGQEVVTVNPAGASAFSASIHPATPPTLERKPAPILGSHSALRGDANFRRRLTDEFFADSALFDDLV